MADIVKVNIWEDEDGEPCWLTRQEEGKPDSDWAGELSFDRMAEWDMAQALANQVIADAVATTNRNMEGDHVQPCDSYDGVTIPEERKWAVVLDQSADPQNEWPARPVDLGEPYSTRAQAETALNSHFGEDGDQSVRLIVAYSNVGHFGIVTRDRVSIEERHRREMVTSCSCGHPKDAHT